MSVAPLSGCSQMLLLPLGVPPTPAPVCFTHSHSHDSEIRRVFTTSDVGNVTQGPGGSRSPSVTHYWCRSISVHFASLEKAGVACGVVSYCEWSVACEVARHTSGNDSHGEGRGDPDQILLTIKCSRHWSSGAALLAYHCHTQIKTMMQTCIHRYWIVWLVQHLLQGPPSGQGVLRGMCAGRLQPRASGLQLWFMAMAVREDAEGGTERLGGGHKGGQAIPHCQCQLLVLKRRGVNAAEDGVGRGAYSRELKGEGGGMAHKILQRGDAAQAQAGREVLNIAPTAIKASSTSRVKTVCKQHSPYPL